MLSNAYDSSARCEELDPKEKALRLSSGEPTFPTVDGIDLPGGSFQVPSPSPSMCLPKLGRTSSSCHCATYCATSYPCRVYIVVTEQGVDLVCDVFFLSTWSDFSSLLIFQPHESFF